MCDLSDVETALATLIAGAIYPNGTGQASTIGVGCYIAPGWPNSTQLDAALVAGEVTVTVYAQPNMEQVTTRYPQNWEDQTLGTATLTATVAARTITIAGTVTAGQYVTLIVGNKAYSYAALVNDTLTTIATALTALVVVDWTGTTSSGAVITVPVKAEGRVTARVAAAGTIIRELKRQNRGFQIIVWAPSPSLRSTTANLIDVALASTDFLTMPDLTKAWMKYRGQNDTDQMERANLYRRDLFYWVEYATTQVSTGYPITAPVTQTQGKNSAGDLGPTVTLTQ